MNIADLGLSLFMLWECQGCHNIQSIRIEPDLMNNYEHFVVGEISSRFLCENCGNRTRYKLLCRYLRGYVGIWEEEEV